MRLFVSQLYNLSNPTQDALRLHSEETLWLMNPSSVFTRLFPFLLLTHWHALERQISKTWSSDGHVWKMSLLLAVWAHMYITSPTQRYEQYVSVKQSYFTYTCFWNVSNLVLEITLKKQHKIATCVFFCSPGSGCLLPPAWLQWCRPN